MKVDVAVQSYKKPEQLIYSLFSLHKFCKDKVDTVWINDDCSGGDVLLAYHRLSESGALAPWKINVRENTQRMGWWVSFVRGVKPVYQTTWFRFKRMLWNLYKVGAIYVNRMDLRYQWAIECTDKRYIFVMHDDIEFKSDIISAYLNKIESNEKMAIVGELGQCWRCAYANDGCTPQKILAGHIPSEMWPSTAVRSGSHAWACRINEWSSLINVDVAKEISEREGVFFGNYDANGDIAAYWFYKVVKMGYGYNDPFPEKEKRALMYAHWENGVTGHSAWVNQGNGKSIYEPEFHKLKLIQDFSYIF